MSVADLFCGKVGEVGMTRDEIISGLEREIKSIRREPKSKMLGICIMVDDAEDIVTLLKEQEAVKPIPPTDESDLWRCGNCNHQLFRCTHQRYCEMCGRAVKWE